MSELLIANNNKAVINTQPQRARQAVLGEYVQSRFLRQPRLSCDTILHSGLIKGQYSSLAF